ncbi:MAG: hypothetical protein KKA79_02925, partial [Nanoarchaeota archaeon]|nr:hypothetical protein [Nanoarchaeota archaeon]MCG2718045.1 hypothetical protein [Nanoarchaeota archaeon]
KLGTKPDFFLLFSTIHYEKYGGFKEFLAGVWEILPKGTPLIGGTVAGFINPEGCFTRGASAMAVSYPNMDVAVGIGRNTKRVPNMAGKDCADMIVKNIKKTKFENTCIIDIISGPSVPTIPIIGSKRVIRSKLLGKFLKEGLLFSSLILQRGFGREEEILTSFGKRLCDYPIIGFSTSDDNNLRTNYSFLDNRVLKNCMLALSISTDIKFDIRGGHGFSPRSDISKITKNDLWGYMIKEMDKMPALKKFLEMSGWTPETVDDEQFYRRSFFYPIGFNDEMGELHPATIGAIWGENLVCGCSIIGDDVVLLSASGRSMIDVVQDLVGAIPINPLMGLFFSCAIRLEALGCKIYHSHAILNNFFKDTPYLLVFGFGENRAIPPTGPTNFNVTIQSFVLGR